MVTTGHFCMLLLCHLFQNRTLPSFNPYRTYSSITHDIVCIRNAMTNTMTSTMTVVAAEKKETSKQGKSSSLKEEEFEESPSAIVRDGVHKEIPKQVLRQKLSKLRHLVVPRGINPNYLDTLFPQMLQEFDPQTVHYNGGVAQVKEWKISCYLEVMDGGIPCTNPNTKLLQLFRPLLDTCNELFLEWYRQQHACNKKLEGNIERSCKRIMTFLTRYTPAPGEQALLKHVDGAGKVDGSIVIALPVDRWSAPEEENSFVGHGGGLTFWDGKDPQKKNKAPREIHYETRSGDLAFIDR
jgi:hypothetical protein